MTSLKIPVTSDDHIQGKDSAAVTLVEYGDYECPFCGRAYPLIKNLQKQWGDQLRFIFRNFPLTELHPYAEAAAETAEFASTKGRFWEMHDLIYENQTRLSFPVLLELTKKLDLSSSELQLAIQNKLFTAYIQNDFLGGVRSGVNGTPTFFINDQRFNSGFEELAYELENLIKTKLA